ncbi:TPA: hypothetical protein PXM28_001483 [Yersinia enterocolitica]|nr:hypothetical protein [Yersinia enterocolitica]
MAIVINHESNQRDNNDDFNHNRPGRDGHGRRGHESHNGDGRGGYGERFGDDNVVDNHNRTDHNRKDHFIEEGRGDGRERRNDCDDDRDGRRDGRRCSKLEAPVVLAPIVAVAAGTTVIGAYPDRVAIQILNNAALLATYTVVLPNLPECETGYVVVETALGITALTVQGPVGNVSPSALTNPGSYIVLKWTGCVWMQI